MPSSLSYEIVGILAYGKKLVKRTRKKERDRKPLENLRFEDKTAGGDICFFDVLPMRRSVQARRGIPHAGPGKGAEDRKIVLTNHLEHSIIRNGHDEEDLKHARCFRGNPPSWHGLCL